MLLPVPVCLALLIVAQLVAASVLWHTPVLVAVVCAPPDLRY